MCMWFFADRFSCDGDTALFHLRDGLIDIARVEIDAAAGVSGKGDMKAFVEGIEGGEFDAVVGGETADGDVGHSALAKPIGHACTVAATVVVKAAVAVDLGAGAFLENFIDAIRVECCREFRALGFLNAMDGPKGLRQAVEGYGFKDGANGVVAREAAVVGRMPVLGGDDEIELAHQKISGGDDFITTRHGKRTAGEKVVLDVN